MTLHYVSVLLRKIWSILGLCPLIPILQDFIPINCFIFIQKMSSTSDSCVSTYYSDDDTSSDASEIEEPHLHLDSIIA
ncbi:hypothetical protein BpHYR1_009079 [Brachionus plicatilis]|uniref:Uncharacterized protein n=1 Tax=Brachionus plicatilis TaxID=10195 RepID=A0A3M7QND6_BRAPC|nr:hypothetical protein BpHYR1_009079 [Brachionus plicatilis]